MSPRILAYKRFAVTKLVVILLCCGYCCFLSIRPLNSFLSYFDVHFACTRKMCFYVSYFFHLVICVSNDCLLLLYRKLCCATVKSLFEHEGKHGGEATVEAVKMIAELVKVHNCQLHPDSIDVRTVLTILDY